MSEFWKKVNSAMREIDSSSMAFVFGHQKANRWCCTTCSSASGFDLWEGYVKEKRAEAEESGNDFDEGFYSDAMFVYYHDQDFSKEATEVYLGWSGKDVPSIVQHFFGKQGLEVVLPPNEDTKIIVREASLVAV